MRELWIIPYLIGEVNNKCIKLILIFLCLQKKNEQLLIDCLEDIVDATQLSGETADIVADE